MISNNHFNKPRTMVPKYNKTKFLNIDKLTYAGKVENSRIIKNLKWNKNFECLKAYHAEHGDSRVLDKSKYNGYNLGSWVSSQRSGKDKLSKKQLDKLNTLEFVWNTSKKKT